MPSSAVARRATFSKSGSGVGRRSIAWTKGLVLVLGLFEFWQYLREHRYERRYERL